MPATKLATPLGGLFVGSGRAVVAAFLAILVLRYLRAPKPPPALWRRLWIVSGGVVLGFPILTALAVQQVPAFHAVVVVGIAPVFTAIIAAIRHRERPTWAFWIVAAVGALAVVTYGVVDAGLAYADLWLLLAAVLVSFGYAEGAELARELGGLRVIAWALIQASPFALLLALGSIVFTGLPHGGASAWLGFGYVSVVSMFLAFVAWYAGLARGGTARMSQVQLIQPVLGVVWCALLLEEAASRATLLTAVVVVACAALARGLPGRVAG